MIPVDIPRQRWGARPPNRPYVAISPRSRPGVEVHHTAGLYGQSTPGGLARAIQRDHLARRSASGVLWTDIFYHALLWYTGDIVELRPIPYKSGALTRLTVVLPGHYDRIAPTEAQRAALTRVRVALRDAGGGTDVAWHAQRARTLCPGRNVIAWLSKGLEPLPGPAPEPEPPKPRGGITVPALIRNKASGAVQYVDDGGVPHRVYESEDREALEQQVGPTATVSEGLYKRILSAAPTRTEEPGR